MTTVFVFVFCCCLFCLLIVSLFLFLFSRLFVCFYFVCLTSHYYERFSQVILFHSMSLSVLVQDELPVE